MVLSGSQRLDSKAFDLPGSQRLDSKAFDKEVFKGILDELANGGVLSSEKVVVDFKML